MIKVFGRLSGQALSRSSWRARLSRLIRRPEMTAAVMLALVAGSLSVLNGTFRTFDNVVWVLHSFSVTGIAAMGILLLIITGVVDLSCGAQMGVAAAITASVIRRYPGTPDPVILGAALTTGVTFGLFNSIMCTKLKLNPFIATLATSYVGRGMSGVFATTVILPAVAGLRWVFARLRWLDSQAVPTRGFPKSLTQLGQGSALGLPLLVWIMVLLMIFWHWVLTRTRYGHWVFAVGANESAAKLSGVPVDSVRTATHISSGLMCALAGFLYTCRMGVPMSGTGYEMDIISGSIIGGVPMDGGAGTVAAAVLGVGLMAFIRNGLVLLHIGALWQQLLTGILTILSIVFDRMRRMND